MSSRPTGVLLLLVYALVFLTPGFFTLPPLDRDESRFAQATKQMLQTGDPVIFRRIPFGHDGTASCNSAR